MPNDQPRADFREHLTKPFEAAHAARPTDEDKQHQKPKVLTMFVKQAPAKEDEKVGEPAKQPTSTRRERGISERVKGLGVWWIRYPDANGKERREKAGTKGMAIKLYQKRKTEAMQGKKLPETIRRRPVLVSELLLNAAKYIRARYCSLGLGSDGYDY